MRRLIAEPSLNPPLSTCMHIHTDTPAAGPEAPVDRSPVPHRKCCWSDKTQVAGGHYSHTISPGTARTLAAEVILQLGYPGVGSRVPLPVDHSRTARTSIVQLSVKAA